MFFKGQHLRVTTPKTTNGQIPLIENGQPQYNVTFAPLTARKNLERKNARLIRTGFKHLAAKIDVVTDEPIEVAPVAAPAPKAPKAPKAPAAEVPAIPQNANEITL
jgi:hypothetical protein